MQPAYQELQTRSLPLYQHSGKRGIPCDLFSCQPPSPVVYLAELTFWSDRVASLTIGVSGDGVSSRGMAADAATQACFVTD